MRRLTLALLFVGSTIAACAESTEGDPATSGGDAGSTTDSGRKDGSSSSGDSSVIDDDAGDEPDASTTKDAGKDGSSSTDAAGDASATDGAVTDGAATDSAVTDSAVTDGAVADAADAAACVVPAGNFARCGTASASSVYNSSYGPELLNDGVTTASWYAETGACPSNTCPGDTIYAQVELNTLRTIGRVKTFGNEDYTDYDVLTGRIQLLGAANNVLYTANVSFSQGTIDHTLTPVANVKTVRIVLLTAEATGPGLAEIQAFAN